MRLTTRQISARLNRLASDCGVYFGSNRVVRFRVSFEQLEADCGPSKYYIPVRNWELDLKAGNGRPMSQILLM